MPSGQWEGAALPWNRRQRKKFLSSPSVIVHLFSGPDQSWWKKMMETSSRVMLCVDREVSSGQDLLLDQVAGFLAEVCEGGAVDALLGGPPCRTVSRLRHQRPGPPVLRARHGPERFALDCLSEADRELALNDATLWFRQLWLFSLAQGARKEKVRP